MADSSGPSKKGGFRYYVSDEQLQAFRRLTPDERLRWLDEMREFSVATAPAAAKAWWQRLRAGR